jgi:molybdopterin-synthase adenylyltransferase
MDRYSRNISAITESENKILQKSSVCVVGCGGLGGYAIEMLARLGVGSITIIDKDSMEFTNLNRQILSSESNIGEKKVMLADRRIRSINKQTICRPIDLYLDEENALELIKGHHVVIDALDSIPARFVLNNACRQAGIPQVHGAIAGWYGQVATIFPDDDTLPNIYPNKNQRSIEKEQGSPAFAPALISSIQVAETIKILIGRGELLRNKLLFINLLEHEYQILSL